MPPFFVAAGSRVGVRCGGRSRVCGVSARAGFVLSHLSRKKRGEGGAPGESASLRGQCVGWVCAFPPCRQEKVDRVGHGMAFCGQGFVQDWLVVRQRDGAS